MRPLIRFSQSLSPSYIARITKRGISNIPPPKRKRNLNLLSQFQRPPPRPRTPLKDVIGPSTRIADSDIGNTRDDEERFKTTSTEPVVSSIQEVPPTDQGMKVVDSIPAMKDVPPSVPMNKADGRRVKEMIVQGVGIPPKPIPPGEEECCMSGCVNCVYTIYADDLELYNEAVELAKERLRTSNVPEDEWPKEIREKKSGEETKEEVVKDVDPVMSAFLALENKLKSK
ncbi:hypothetical protein I302_100182 [Kwoniella bestiolae CBS 10118]|uniref:Oxidoreductase-like domain-containing protein n=1 Tax=Kwoniella bestiolae CBS 10118 TaxID=1296100 RepID=A0A1B9G4F2_9TREE|nr:hypothetical protein I302_03557 [Kwoniella bestiolae CBS 10118]OCF25881.1 hypothetical protein I302_03557 [Kwoniella bestiolae CBS 10118]